MAPSNTESAAASIRQLVREHSRRWGECRYVYPVMSRRSDGLSIGINLCPDQHCNFNCVYCQVQRNGQPIQRQFIDLAVLQAELEQVLDLVTTETFWQQGPFANVDPAYRRVDNIAFSGDGEPTLCRWFQQAVAVAAAAKIRRHLDQVKLVLITNATRLREPGIAEGLKLMMYYQGEIWAKLDAGAPATYAAMNRSRVPFETVLENLRHAGRVHALVIQSMFLHQRAEPLRELEAEAYLDCLAGLLADGCRILRVQLYTLARQPAESWVSPLSNAEMDALAERFRRRLPDLPVRAFYSA